MLYSEKELEKCLKAGCALYYFYASDEALVHTAAQKTLKYLNRDDPETTVLDGPTPSVEEIVLAAGTISFFGGKRLVLMPLIRPSTYSDKDLQELCDTLADTENLVNYGIETQGIRLAMMAIERDAGTRFSLRGKGAVDVSRIAQRFGGGGHPCAAGATVNLPMDEAIEAVLRAATDERED